MFSKKQTKQPNHKTSTKKGKENAHRQLSPLDGRCLGQRLKKAGGSRRGREGPVLPRKTQRRARDTLFPAASLPSHFPFGSK